jgi:hypothetical protein
LRHFRSTLLKRKVLTALKRNYQQNIVIIQKIMSNTQIIKRQQQTTTTGRYLDGMKRFKEDAATADVKVSAAKT